jgi:hypothetical protein
MRVLWLQRWLGRVQARSQRSQALVGHPFAAGRIACRPVAS